MRELGIQLDKYTMILILIWDTFFVFVIIVGDDDNNDGDNNFDKLGFQIGGLTKRNVDILNDISMHTSELSDITYSTWNF